MTTTNRYRRSREFAALQTSQMPRLGLSSRNDSQLTTCAPHGRRRDDRKIAAIAVLWHVVRIRCNLRCAAQILEHVLRLPGSRAFTQEVIRSAQGAYFFRYRRP